MAVFSKPSSAVGPGSPHPPSDRQGPRSSSTKQSVHGSGTGRGGARTSSVSASPRAGGEEPSLRDRSEFFSLPPLSRVGDPARLKSLSRSVRRRIEERDRVSAEVNEALRCMAPLLDGGVGRGPLPETVPLFDIKAASFEQGEMYRGIRRDVVRQLGAERAHPLTGAEAFGVLTAKTSLYGDRKDMAGYHDAKHAVPGSGIGAIPLLQFQEGIEAELLRDPSRFLREPDPEVLAQIKPYWDPVLLEGGRDYHDAIDAYLSAGITDWSTDEPEEQCGLFYVWKSNGELRVIGDCRRADARMIDPPNTDLGGAGSIADMWVDPTGEEYRVGTD
jgi:hypothetical protein